MSHYHQILGIPINAGKETIKRAYREKAKIYHPDINPSTSAKDNFIRIHRAYKYLMENHGEIDYSRSRRSTTSPNREEQIRQARERAAQRAKHRAAQLAKMRYEQFQKEEEAFRNSAFVGLYKLLYFLGYLIQIFLALIIGSIPFFAGFNNGWFSFFLVAPIFFFGTFAMIQKATKWKREINQSFIGGEL